MSPGASSHCFKLEFLRQSQHHTVFLSPSNVTGGHPSGGLACVFKRSIQISSPVLFYSDEFLLAMRVARIVFVNSYHPYKTYSIRSLTKSAKACDLLKNLVNQVLSNSLQYIIIGDINTDINRSSVRSDLLFERLPSYRTVAKSHKFSYVHYSGSASDTDHIICWPGIIFSSASLQAKKQDTDHIPISVTFTMDTDLSKTNYSQENRSGLKKATGVKQMYRATSLL